MIESHLADGRQDLKPGVDAGLGRVDHRRLHQLGRHRAAAGAPGQGGARAPRAARRRERGALASAAGVAAEGVRYVGFWARAGRGPARPGPGAVRRHAGRGLRVRRRLDRRRAACCGFVVNWVPLGGAIIAFWVMKGATPGKMAISAVVVDARDARAGRLLAGADALRRLLRLHRFRCSPGWRGSASTRASKAGTTRWRARW